MIVDIHAHIPKPGQHICGVGRFQGDLEPLADVVRRAGVDRMYISSMVATEARSAEELIAGNELAERGAERFPGLFRPACVVDRRYVKASREELDRRVAEGPMRLVGEIISFHTQGHVDREFLPVIERAIDLDVPMLLHASFPMDVQAVARLADLYPRGRFILAHIGGIRGWAAGIEAAALRHNMWVDISGYTLFLRGVVESAVQRVSEDEVLFGSDFCAMDAGGAVQRVRHMDLNETQKAKVFGGNWLSMAGDRT